VEGPHGQLGAGFADGLGGDAAGGAALPHPALCHWVLANLVAHRQNGSFPTIGKYFSNGWKTPYLTRAINSFPSHFLKPPVFL
jgi:hypothetical protein